MRVIAVIQARLGSARLPGKATLLLQDRPMLDHVLERVSAVAGLADAVLATTTDERDGSLLRLAAARGIRSWRGSEPDVMQRIFDAAQSVQADAVMRVTADCPLFAPDVAGFVLGAFLEGQCPPFPFTAPIPHYVSNDTTCSGYPDGLDVEVFSMVALAKSLEATHWRETAANSKAEQKRLRDREHVTAWMREHLRSAVYRHDGADLTHLKLSVDRQEDFDRVQTVYDHLAPGDLVWSSTARACGVAGLLNGVAI